MKRFLTLCIFNYKKFIKMRMVWFVVISLVIGFGGFLYYVGLVTTDSRIALYVQNETDVDVALWQTALATFDRTAATYELKEEKGDGNNYPQVVLSQQGERYILGFKYKNDGNEDFVLEEDLAKALQIAVGVEVVEVNIYAHRTHVNIENGKAQIVGQMVMWLSYVLILLCGVMILQNVATEKVNKIMDILAYKVSPAMLIFAKICASMVLICQLLCIFVLEMFLFQYFDILSSDFLMQLLIDLNLGHSEVGLIILFSLLGCFVYSVLYAIAGICVSSQEQQLFAHLPVTGILFVAFGLTQYALTMGEINVMVLQYASYIPVIAPLTLPGVLISGGYQYTDLIIPSVTMALFLAVVTWVMNKVIVPRKIN